MCLLGNFYPILVIRLHTKKQQRYVVMAVIGTSSGLVVGGHVVDHLLSLKGWNELDAFRAIFWIYAGVGCFKALMILFLSRQCEQAEKEVLVSNEREPLLNGTEGSENGLQTPLPPSRPSRWSNPISMISKQNRWILFKLCSLFFLDSLASGMVPFSLINLYMERKFRLGKGQLGGIMSATCECFSTAYAQPLTSGRVHIDYWKRLRLVGSEAPWTH